MLDNVTSGALGCSGIITGFPLLVFTLIVESMCPFAEMFNEVYYVQHLSTQNFKDSMSKIRKQSMGIF